MTDHDRDRPVEIEITKEMISAGVSEFLAWEASDNPYLEVVVAAIYSAMKNAEQI